MFHCLRPLVAAGLCVAFAEAAEAAGRGADLAREMQQTGKPALIIAGNEGCVYCRQMAEELATDRSIQHLAQQYLILKINTESADWPRLRETFKFEEGGIPAVFVVRADGELLYSDSGKPRDMSDFLERYLESAGTILESDKLRAMQRAVRLADRNLKRGNYALVWPIVQEHAGSGSYAQAAQAIDAIQAAFISRVTDEAAMIYMPNMPEAVIGMLACARIGAIHSVVFGGFAPNELATRIDDARPRVILSASCGIEVDRVIEYKPLLDAAIEGARAKPEHCVVLQRPHARAALVPGRDVDWNELVASASAVDCVPVAATDPLYILYTSGTTGIPKGVVRDNAGHMVALAWSMKAVYDVDPGEVYWAASDIGWAVGHSYIVYGPLVHGCTTILYEGKPVGTPDPGAFWRVISEHGVNLLFTAPTAFRAIKRDDPDAVFVGKYDLSKFRTLFLAGERADPDTIRWAERALGVPVIDHWWQTETGWPMAANCLGIERMPVKYGSPTRAVPGYDVRVLDPAGAELGPDETGAIVVKLPLPPGCLPTLWQNDEGYVQSYLSTYDGYYLTADAGYLDADGYLYVMSMVLEGRFRRRAERRGDRAAREVRRAAPDGPLYHAHVPD